MCTAIQTFDGRRIAVLCDPHEIRPCDWMRDLGRLRQVEDVQPVTLPLSAGVLVRFTDDQDGVFATLSVPDGVTVTVWRELAEAGVVSCVAA